jgi:hypothetical protein
MVKEPSWITKKQLEFREFTLKNFPRIDTITKIAVSTLFGGLSGMIVGQPIPGACLGFSGAVINLAMKDINSLICSLIKVNNKLFLFYLSEMFSLMILFASASLIAFTIFNLSLYEFGIILLLLIASSILYVSVLFGIYLVGDCINNQIKKVTESAAQIES